MNAKEMAEAIKRIEESAIYKAWQAGEQLQWLDGAGHWVDSNDFSIRNFLEHPHHIRIKPPEPEPREYWSNVYPHYIGSTHAIKTKVQQRPDALRVGHFVEVMEPERRFWVNVYPRPDSGYVGPCHASKEAADEGASIQRTECLEVVAVRRFK